MNVYILYDDSTDNMLFDFGRWDYQMIPRITIEFTIVKISFLFSLGFPCPKLSSDGQCRWLRIVKVLCTYRGEVIFICSRYVFWALGQETRSRSASAKQRSPPSVHVGHNSSQVQHPVSCILVHATNYTLHYITLSLLMLLLFDHHHS